MAAFTEQMANEVPFDALLATFVPIQVACLFSAKKFNCLFPSKLEVF